jgi:hypothetical protein
MDKRHALGLLTTALLGLACNDRLATTNDVPVEPLCLRAIGTRGHRADGTNSIVQWPRGGTPYVCICITEEQFWDPDEIERQAEELNDLLLDECERSAALQGFIWNECEADHDLGSWTDAYRMGTFLGTFQTSFSCGGEGWLADEEPEQPLCELGTPGCSCTVEATCTGGTTCIDGMCQTP